jgi:hypothetical protein
MGRLYLWSCTHVWIYISDALTNSILCVWSTLKIGFSCLLFMFLFDFGMIKVLCFSFSFGGVSIFISLVIYVIDFGSLLFCSVLLHLEFEWDKKRFRPTHIQINLKTSSLILICMQFSNLKLYSMQFFFYFL